LHDWSMFGTLTSPLFPSSYPRDTQLRWNISVPDGFRVKLYFSHFDLEPSYLCEYDAVQVEAEGEVLALFCGREETDTEAVPAQQIIISPRNSLGLLFSSDFSNEERYSGFMAHYSAVDVDECSERKDEDLLCDHVCHNYIGGHYCSCRHGYLLHSDNRTCAVECSEGVFRERSGVLSSVDFPSPYPKSSECSYRIEVDPGFRILLRFDPRFDVEDHPDVSCPYDHVKITAGSSEFGPFCGDRPPGDLQTDSNNVTISFHSDNSGEHLGWRITYTSTGRYTPSTTHRYTPTGRYTPSTTHRYTPTGRYTPSTTHRYTSTVVDCGSPKSVAMAELVFGINGNSTQFGSTVHYVCREDSLQLTNSNSKNIMTVLPKVLKVHEAVLRQFVSPCVCPACGRPSRSLPPQVKRIVGGRHAEPGLFPWQVLLSVEDLSRVPEDRWFGSGALLSQSWVLTAAHVLRSQRRDTTVVPVVPEHVKVFLGLHDAADKRLATNRSVEKIFLHPNFQPDNYNNDIALLRLEEQVEFTEFIRPDDPPSPLPNTLGLVAGWGISNFNTTSSSSDPSKLTADPEMTSDLLQYVKLPVVSQDECEGSYASRSVSYNITDNMFCAGFLEGGKDTCLGDSGGAFVMQDGVSRRWVVFGLVSWAGPEDCGSQRVYGVYTRVANYVEWIQKQLQTAPWW
uniref:MBL associated serine protease 1 n=1 Tax=Cyclopterus lumpus TaxID=8103 RepID=A0A8C2YYY5_CYCLU